MRRILVIGALMVPGPMVWAVQPNAIGVSADAPIFTPPIDHAQAYRVTTRRVGRDGAMVSFSANYQLRWARSGRGYRLEATLVDIVSDAKPQTKRLLTAMLEPLVGETIAYLVSADGTEIMMIDRDKSLAAVLGRAVKVGETSDSAEAKQLARMFAAMPAEQREAMAVADLRAIIVAASSTIPRRSSGADPHVSIQDKAGVRTIALTERDSVAGARGAKVPVHIETFWAIDSATGLVQSEHRQSWIVEPGSGARTLFEEHIRTLEAAAY